MSKSGLIKKDIKGSSFIGIAEKLRAANEMTQQNIVQDNNPVLVENESKADTVQDIADEVVSNNEFSQFLKSAKSKEYDFTSQPIKIDVEVKEIFTRIKGNTKIPISSLISYILEEWIEKHEDDIKTLLMNKKNRFL